MPKVGIVMGSDSDLPVVTPCLETLIALGIPYAVRIISAHRTPNEARDFALRAREAGFGVLIAFAGRAAHLAGALAANTTLPVIGVPVANGALNGIDALLSTVQMPSGVPVATVAIDGAQNAAYLAAQIFAVSDERLAAALNARRAEDFAKIKEKERALGDDLRMRGFLQEA